MFSLGDRFENGINHVLPKVPPHLRASAFQEENYALIWLFSTVL